MKKSVLLMLTAALLTACGQTSDKNDGREATEQCTASATQLAEADSNTVTVYYFHGKQRCKTCMAVGRVSKETVDSAYAGNGHVRFVEINTEEKANKALVEKFQIAWNALIIEKDGNSTDLTKEGFANAVKSPDMLIELIKKEVDKMLQQP